MGASTLVTGGAGFIGSHLVRRLLERGDRVRVLDDFSTGRRENLEDVAGDVEIVEADLRDGDRVLAATHGVEVVFHQGALPSVPRSLEDPLTTTAVIVEGSLNVLLAAREAGAPRVVLASSSSVYGDNGALPRRESARPAPLSPYAVSKLAAEGYSRSFARDGGPEAVCLRYFNVFGPRQDPDSPYAAVVPRFVSAIAAGQSAIVHGDGGQSRDFTYVADVVEANLLAADAEGIGGDVLNVSGGRPATVLELADTVGALLDRPVRKRHVAARLGDVRESWADLSRARERIGYQPRTSLAEGLEITIRSALSEVVEPA